MSTAQKRVAAVQIPGEEPKKPEAEKPSETLQDRGTAQGAESGQAEGNATPAIDIEALREQIRAEEQAKLRAELSNQIEVAKSVAAKPSAKPLGRRDYLQMNADDIDPATLTAPVRTKDGWLCPPVPEAKK